MARSTAGNVSLTRYLRMNRYGNSARYLGANLANRNAWQVSAVAVSRLPSMMLATWNSPNASRLRGQYPPQNRPATLRTPLIRARFNFNMTLYHPLLPL